MAFPRVTGFAPVCQSSMAEAVCLSSTPVPSEIPTSVCPYQSSTGRCSCTSQAPLDTISAISKWLFRQFHDQAENTLGCSINSPGGRQMLCAEGKGWVFPARVSMEVCSDQAADPRGYSRQTDRQTASCPCASELHPLSQHVGMCYHRDPPEMPCDGERVVWSCPMGARLSC